MGKLVRFRLGVEPKQTLDRSGRERGLLARQVGARLGEPGRRNA